MGFEDREDPRAGWSDTASALVACAPLLLLLVLVGGAVLASLVWPAHP